MNELGRQNETQGAQVKNEKESDTQTHTNNWKPVEKCCWAGNATTKNKARRENASWASCFLIFCLQTILQSFCIGYPYRTEFNLGQHRHTPKKNHYGTKQSVFGDSIGRYVRVDAVLCCVLAARCCMHIVLYINTIVKTRTPNITCESICVRAVCG